MTATRKSKEETKREESVVGEKKQHREIHWCVPNRRRTQGEEVGKRKSMITRGRFPKDTNENALSCSPYSPFLSPLYLMSLSSQGTWTDLAASHQPALSRATDACDKVSACVLLCLADVHLFFACKLIFPPLAVMMLTAHSA